jgi:hypothetical protein
VQPGARDGLAGGARRALLCGLLVLLGLPSVAHANGGVQELTLAPAGPYEVTALVSPTPVRPGLVDVSVLVYQAQTDRLVQDARVTILAQELGQVQPGVTFPATHARASNPLYYAADVQLPRPGRWRLTIDVSSQLGAGTVAFEVEATQGDALDGLRLWLLRTAFPLVVAVGWLRQAPAAALLVGALLGLAGVAWWSRSRRRAPPRS